MQKPYASVPQTPPYNGPAIADGPPGPVRIGIFGRNADKTADALAPVLARFSGRCTVVTVASDVPWGKASTALVHLIYDDHILGLITTDRDSSHLAEQLAVKSFVPVLAMSSDRALTAINMPWLFRVSPETPVSEALTTLLQAIETGGPNRGRVREALAAREAGW